MEFNEILEKYEDDINYANRMLTPKCLSFFKESEDYWKGYKKACFAWFQAMKQYTDFKPLVREATEEEKKKFIYHQGETGFGPEPDKVMGYRGEIVPIYFDDYGQQEVAIFEGEIIPGGAFNTMAYYDFCFVIDRIKDKII